MSLAVVYIHRQIQKRYASIANLGSHPSAFNDTIQSPHTFGIERNKIGYFTLDNAENNSTSMEVIGGELGFNGRQRRGRCIGHTINLAAKALLFGHHPDAFEQQLDGAMALTDADYQEWRRQGPVGKLHNLVVDIRNVQVLSRGLYRLQLDEIDRSAATSRKRRPLRVISDNNTRWLSQLYIIRRALRLKTTIRMLLIVAREDWDRENASKRTSRVSATKLQKLPRYLTEENHLSDEDWDALQHPEGILTIFETVVKTLEGDGKARIRKDWSGSYGNVWDVVLGFELLLSKLEEYKQLAESFPNPEHFRVGINLAWQKLDEYYQRLDETPIYYTALALHPAYRWDWFDEMWHEKPAWVAKAKALVLEVWATDYAHLDIRTISCGSSRSDDEPVAKRPRFHNPFDNAERVAKPSRPAAVIGDEYTAWQLDREVGDGEVRDPLAYWFERQERYPRLSQMAMDFITIQPMSAECERAFSAAGQMVTPTRNRLEAVTIAMCQVLRSWYRAGIIQGQGSDSEVAKALQSDKDDETSSYIWQRSDDEVYSEASEAEDIEYSTSSSDSE